MNTPTIAGDWWTIAGVPDLGRFNSETIEPMDFSVWRAGDGNWQLGACAARLAADTGGCCFAGSRRRSRKPTGPNAVC